MENNNLDKWTLEDEVWLRQFIKKDMNKEAEQIIKTVYMDSALRDVQAPPEIQEKLLAQIQEYEEQKSRDGK